jgi:hypothetical protein
LIIVDCEGSSGPNVWDCGATVVKINKKGEERIRDQKILFNFPTQSNVNPAHHAALTDVMKKEIKRELDEKLNEPTNRVVHWSNGPEAHRGGILRNLEHNMEDPETRIFDMFQILRYLWRRYGVKSAPSEDQRLSFAMYFLNALFSPGVKYEHKGLSDCLRTAVPIVSFLDWLLEEDRYQQISVSNEISEVQEDFESCDNE